jgi:FtsZ-binding cell division protein ZapB
VFIACSLKVLYGCAYLPLLGGNLLFVLLVGLNQVYEYPSVNNPAPLAFRRYQQEQLQQELDDVQEQMRKETEKADGLHDEVQRLTRECDLLRSEHDVMKAVSCWWKKRFTGLVGPDVGDWSVTKRRQRVQRQLEGQTTRAKHGCLLHSAKERVDCSCSFKFRLRRCTRCQPQLLGAQSGILL